MGDFPATLTPGWLSDLPSFNWRSAHDHLPHLRGCAAPSSNDAGVGKPSDAENGGWSPQAIVEDTWHNQALCFIDVGFWFLPGLISGSSGRRGAIWKLRGKPPKSCGVSWFSLYFKYSIFQQTQNCMVNWGYQPTTITEGPFLSGVWTWSSLQFLELPLGSLKFLRARFLIQIDSEDKHMHHLGLGFRIV